jgi:hypothetical protein
MTNITEPIANRMLDRFELHPDAMPIRDIILDYTLTISDADMLTDCATLHLTLDDELHHILLIAIFDRDDLHIDTLILNADSTTRII